MEIKPVKSGWYNAFRPWTLHGAIVPVVLGGAVAFCSKYPETYDGDGLDILMFVLVLIGAVLLQSAANLLNTYGDFKEGLDTVENHTRSPELVTGTLKPKHVKYMGFACLGITALIGIVLIWYCGWGILIFGLAGIAGAACYTIGPAYKYYGLGQISVFVMMGLLECLGTYFVLTGTVTTEVLLISLPNAFMITAVLAGNELRDFESDKSAGIKTTSIRLGYDLGMFVYRFECAVAFAIVAILCLAQTIPYFCLLSFLTFPFLCSVFKNSAKAHEDKKCGSLLVPMAFKLNWMFGGLLAIGYILGSYLVF